MGGSVRVYHFPKEDKMSFLSERVVNRVVHYVQYLTANAAFFYCWYRDILACHKSVVPLLVRNSTTTYLFILPCSTRCVRSDSVCVTMHVYAVGVASKIVWSPLIIRQFGQ